MDEDLRAPGMGPGERFWAFSLELYGRHGVSAACVDVQDRFGVDVVLALWVLWVASERGAPSRAEVDRAIAVSAPWRAAAVAPIRAVRRALKPGVDGWASERVQAYRRSVQRIELEAERLQHLALAELDAQGGAGDARIGVATLFDALGVDVPAAAEAFRPALAAASDAAPEDRRL